MLPNLVTRKYNQLTTFNFCVFIVLQIVNKINHFFEISEQCYTFAMKLVH